MKTKKKLNSSVTWNLRNCVVEGNKLKAVPLKDVYQLHGNGFSFCANYEIKIMRETATFGSESCNFVAF